MKDAPGIASWLLARFGCGANNEVVLGDLSEHYQDNHSRTWFWRQVLIALVAGFRTELSLHRLGAARALLLGWFVLSLASLLMLSLFTNVLQARRINEWLYREDGVGFLFLGLLALAALLGCVSTYACGRLLARMFRPRHRAPVLLFAGSIVVGVIVSVVTKSQSTSTIFSVDGIFSPNVTVWISPRAWIYAMGNPLALLALLAGAGFFRRARRTGVTSQIAGVIIVMMLLSGCGLERRPPTVYWEKPDTLSHVVRPPNTMGWDFSIEDMARMGMANIVEKGGPWNWRDSRPGYGPVVFRVEVK